MVLQGAQAARFPPHVVQDRGAARAVAAATPPRRQEHRRRLSPRCRPDDRALGARQHDGQQGHVAGRGQVGVVQRLERAGQDEERLRRAQPFLQLVPRNGAFGERAGQLGAQPGAGREDGAGRGCVAHRRFDAGRVDAGPIALGRGRRGRPRRRSGSEGRPRGVVEGERERRPGTPEAKHHHRGPGGEHERTLAGNAVEREEARARERLPQVQQRLVRAAPARLLRRDGAPLGACQEICARGPRRRVEPQLVPLAGQLERQRFGAGGPDARDEPAPHAIADLGQDAVEADGVQPSP